MNANTWLSAKEEPNVLTSYIMFEKNERMPIPVELWTYEHMFSKYAMLTQKSFVLVIGETYDYVKLRGRAGKNRSNYFCFAVLLLVYFLYLYIC